MGRIHHFVLVHGAQHGAWCWYKTKALLEGAGHRVTALDLTSAGINPVRGDDVISFDHYSQPLYDALESLAESEKVVLVGHSYGGLSVARASERYASKVHVAIYVGAIMLCSGQSCSDIHAEMFGQFEKVMRFQFGRGAGAQPTAWAVVDEAVQDTYYGSCSPEDVQLGRLLLRPSPCVSRNDGTSFTARGYHSVPRVYIRTALDTLVQPQFQDLFISRNQPKEVRTIETGHAPFLSASKEFHQHLVQIAATYAT